MRRIPLEDPQFYNHEEIMKEIRRVFDICHGCRRCFNLCSLFPKLFSMMDSPEVDGDVERLSPQQIDEVIGDCTLCDMCFIAKCPYVPPHPWNIDFPRLMLRYRAWKVKNHKASWIKKRLASMDEYGPIATSCASLTNKTMQCACLRQVGQVITGIDAEADMPPFRSGQLKKQWRIPLANPRGPAFGECVTFYLTCTTNYYESSLAQNAALLLANWGVQVESVYPGCCGMPLLEQGQVTAVSQAAQTIAPQLPQGLIIPLTPSCTLMLQSEWPSLCPDNTVVQDLAKRTQDLSWYILNLVQRFSIPLLNTISDKIAVHMACHVRAQNQGNPAFQLIKRMVPHARLIEKCSGHGGMWGYMKEHFPQAIKMGRGVIRASDHSAILLSECPLAARHLQQVLRTQDMTDVEIMHPIEFLARHLYEKSSDAACSAIEKER